MLKLGALIAFTVGPTTGSTGDVQIMFGGPEAADEILWHAMWFQVHEPRWLLTRQWKRFLLVWSYVASPEYAVSGYPEVPDPFDESMPKRKWERLMLLFRERLR